MRRTPIWPASGRSCRCSAMRSMASGAAFHCASLHATQQAFLEAHELAFAYFRGVFRKLRYDNLTSAVKKILRGHRREETARFIAFRSHWRFEASSARRRKPHEKGGVEGEAGYFRRNHWVPVPQAADLAELNRQLLAACQRDEQRGSTAGATERRRGAAGGAGTSAAAGGGRDGPGADQLSHRQQSGLRQGAHELLLGAVAGWNTGASEGVRQQSSNSGMTAAAWLATSDVTAANSRCSIWNITSMCCTESQAHWPARGRWSSSGGLVSGRRASIEIWQALMTRHGKQSGTRQMIGLLKLAQAVRPGHVCETRSKRRLETGCTDAAAVQHLLHAQD